MGFTIFAAMENALKLDADLIVIGGGAAGFFGAIQAASSAPQMRIVILEKSAKWLSKVRISGGGRCNVTNAERDLRQFAASYPRGERWMKMLLHHFGPDETCQWFAERGVELVSEADGRMFPRSNTSESVIHCLMSEAASLGIRLELQKPVQAIEPQNGYFEVKGKEFELRSRYVLMATGGFPKMQDYAWLNNLSLEIQQPVPSLFTFNLPSEPITELMGVAAEASVKIPEAKVMSRGPLLITHWGISGPAVLRCSAYGARKLAELGYRYQPRVNWLPDYNPESAYQALSEYKEANPNRKKSNKPFPQLPQRLWNYLLEKAKLDPEQAWSATRENALRSLAEMLCNDLYKASGKTTYKEEFVTAGGVSLSQVQHNTCEHKRWKGLYFAGELLDADGITGGFNFQHAWTTGYVAGKAIAASFTASTEA